MSNIDGLTNVSEDDESKQEIDMEDPPAQAARAMTQEDLQNSGADHSANASVPVGGFPLPLPGYFHEQNNEFRPPVSNS